MINNSVDNLVDLIKKDIQNKKDKYIANKYYRYKPQDQPLTIDVVDNNGEVRTIDVEKSTKLYINYFKMLVNQKVEYLLSNEPTINSKLPYTNTVITDMLESLVLNASLDTTAWLHFYVYKNKLDWIIIHDVEIIPIYDMFNKNIEEIIRYYLIDKDTYKIEHWTLTGISYHIIKKDKITSLEDTTHYQTNEEYQGQIVNSEYFNFKILPFIPLYNNKAKISDLDDVRECVDYYNSICSGLIDNIDKFQEAITLLKGFSGDESNLKDTLKNMRKYKMVGLPEGGDIGSMTVEIPVEARALLIELLKDNIFLLGRGVDPNKIGDGNITNIVIRSRYENLNMKCNSTEKQVKLFFEQFINFINTFYNSSYNKEIECNRAMLFNQSELIQDCVTAIDLVDAEVLSRETLCKNIVWVKDVKKEMKLIEAEKEAKKEEQEEQQEKNYLGTKPL